MKKQLLFLALVAGIVTSSVQAMSSVEKIDAAEQKFMSQFRELQHETINKLQKLFNDNKNYKFNIDREWSQIQSNLQTYAGKGSLGVPARMGILAEKIYNILKEPYKQIMNAQATGNVEQTMRSQNAYNLTDRALVLAHLYYDKK